MLLETLRNDMLRFKKEKSPNATLLSTLYSEALAVGKNNGNRETTDEEVVRVVKKFLKAVEETANYCRQYGNEAGLEKANEEQKVLENYLPTQYTGDELSALVDKVIAQEGATNVKEMGRIMKVLTTDYTGQFDGKEASALVRSKLQ